MGLKPDQIKTLVIKIGTNVLSGQRAFEGQVLEGIVKNICRLKHQYDMNILIVSSGAVGCGMNSLGLEERPQALPVKQAVAAVGQATLMHYYQTLFATYGEGLNTAQVLLTLSDLDNRQSHLNVRNTLHALFDLKGVIPIINENDSTAVEELRFSDNDTLGARIASKTNADLMIILSDVQGLYDKDPAKHKDATLIRQVEEITPEIEALAGGAGSVASTGGMRTKLSAARIASAAGVPVVIADGHLPNVIDGVIEGTLPCTCFAAAKTALPHRKRWIAFGRMSQGALRVDAGAHKALAHQGKSLLAAGIIGVDERFEMGDTVDICDPSGHSFARGLVNYGSQDIERIQGRRSSEIAAILGEKDFDEVVHRDNLVLLP